MLDSKQDQSHSTPSAMDFRHGVDIESNEIHFYGQRHEKN